MSGISNFVNAPSSVGTSPMTGANQLHHQARAGILFVTMRTCFIVRYPFATHIPQPRPRDTLLSYPRVNDVTIAEAPEPAAFGCFFRPSFRMQKPETKATILTSAERCRSAKPTNPPDLCPTAAVRKCSSFPPTQLAQRAPASTPSWYASYYDSPPFLPSMVWWRINRLSSPRLRKRETLPEHAKARSNYDATTAIFQALNIAYTIYCVTSLAYTFYLSWF